MRPTGRWKIDCWCGIAVQEKKRRQWQRCACLGRCRRLGREQMPEAPAWWCGIYPREITRCTALGCPAQIRAAAFFVATLLWVGSARSSEHPQYGGVLRVELRAGAVVMNPQKWQAGAPDFASNVRMAALVFDRLVALDNYGRL